VTTAFPADWPVIRRRYEAWWAGELLNRPLICVTAPRFAEPADDPDPAPLDETDLLDWFTNPARVLPRLERQVARTYYAGDAFPVVFPISTSLPAIEAAYLGTPYRIVPVANSGWSSPLIHDWSACPALEVDPDNFWWRATQRLLEAGARQAGARYAVGIPDLQGGGQIVAELRGSQQLAFDLYDDPEPVKRAIEAVNVAWWYYYRACFEIIHRYSEGWVDWLGVWSEVPAVTVECDFSGMISPHMFEEFFVSALRQQTEWVERSIYHLDGPGAICQLDLLLALPRLNGIQWVPGAGQAPMSEWISLLRRIQDGGKLLELTCESWEVMRLFEALEPQGVLIHTRCNSPADANALVAEVERRFGR
jgi:hypothetical protein